MPTFNVKQFLTLSTYTGILTGTRVFRVGRIFLGIAIILALQPTWFVFTTVYPYTKHIEKRIYDMVNDVYPAELIITIKNGLASSNVTEPYYVMIRRETLENVFAFKPTERNSTAKTRLLAIDTNGKAEEFEQYQSLALLTKNSLVYYRDGKISIYPLRDIQTMTVSKETILAKVKDVTSRYHIFKVLSWGLFLSPVLIIASMYLILMATFFFLSLGVYLFVKINQLPYKFGLIYRYTVAITLIPILIWDIFGYIPYFAILTHFLDTLHTMLIFTLAYMGVAQLKSSTT